MKVWVLSFAALLSLAPAIISAGDCCKSCGCQCAPQRVCRAICEIKKVPKTTYSFECEEFCVPGRSERVGSHMECVPDPHRCGGTKEKRVWDWRPGCAQVKTRTKLVKTVTDKEAKTYRWVVEDLCPTCATQPATTELR